jgi:hypothetical protein
MSGSEIVSELERIIEKLEDAAKQCAEQLLRTKEAQDLINESDNRIREILPPDSVAGRIFERETRSKTEWWDPTISGFVAPKDCGHIQSRIALIQRILEKLEPTFLRTERPAKEQYYFAAGDSYRSKMCLYQIMKKACNELAVVDLYLDDQIFGYVESLDDSLKILLLTGRYKPIFKTLYDALKLQRSNLEAKHFQGCHDRFAVLDNKEVWHLGASINGFGKDAFMISKVIDEDERTRFLRDFSNWWSNGKPI